MNKNKENDFNVKEIYIEITSRCNMNCKFCPYGVMNRKKQDMPSDLVKKILDELYDIKNSKIDIPLVTFHCMGEPLLNKNLSEYMTLCDQYEIPYWIVSNGLLFSKKRTEEIFSHKKLHHLELSFHTISERSFKLRGIPKLEYNEYLDRIKNAVFSHTRYVNKIPLQIDVMYDLNIDNGKIFDGFRIKEWRFFLETIKAWGEEIERENPEIFEEERKFYKNRSRHIDLGESVIYRDLTEVPDMLFEELPDRVTFLSWEVVPHLLVTLKKFFIFSPNECYLEQICQDTNRKIIIKEHSGFRCELAKQLVVLSDGKIVPCCLDYDENGISYGNIKDITLRQAANCTKRATLINKTDKFSFCRKCRGSKEILSKQI